MDRDQFWQLIEETKPEGEAYEDEYDSEGHADALAGRLAALAPEEIEAFAREFQLVHNEAYSWDLWGVAHIALGGCSDDAFHYFKGWLIGQGRDVFEQVLGEPESIGDYIREGAEEEVVFDGEPLNYAAAKAYEQAAGGKSLPSSGVEAMEQPTGEPSGRGGGRP